MRFCDIHGPTLDEFIWFGDSRGPKPHEFIAVCFWLYAHLGRPPPRSDRSLASRAPPEAAVLTLRCCGSARLGRLGPSSGATPDSTNSAQIEARALLRAPKAGPQHFLHRILHIECCASAKQDIVCRFATGFGSIDVTKP